MNKPKTCICKYCEVCKYPYDEDECKIEPEFRTFGMGKILNMTWMELKAMQMKNKQKG
jgi:hypothetical protein